MLSTISLTKGNLLFHKCAGSPLTLEFSSYNIELVKDGMPRTAFLANFKTTKFFDEDLIERSAVLFYFVEPNGNWFKAMYRYEPYFYVSCRPEILR